MKTLKDVDFAGKRVFLRGDLDVDVANSNYAVRLEGLKSSVEYLISHSAKQIIIAGHIGRPEGKDEKLSTKHLLPALRKLLGQEIEFLDKFSNINSQSKIVLLENLRFWEGEEKNDPEFVKELVGIADVYINEAFGVSHREHASIVGVPALLPHAAGLHLEEEVGQLTKLIKEPERPMVAIIGGAKLETKVPVIDALTKVADWVLVGGLIAKEIRDSKLTILGSEKVFVANLTEDTKDIDEASIAKFREIIKGAETIVWNGPVGYFEGGFTKGTLAIANAIINAGAYSVIGGGETTEFLQANDLLSGFSFVSSGGGAMLEYLSGKDLPGIKALD